MVDIVILIVNWNGGEKILQCIHSLYKNIGVTDHKIIVVDNDSSDESVSRIKEYFKEVKIIKNAKNDGFSKANNIGLKYIIENNIESRYILFLNNDTEFVDSSIINVIDFLEQNKNVIALTPCVTESNGEFQTGVGGKTYNIKNVIIYYFFLNKLPFLREYGVNLDQSYFYKKKRVIHLDWISGGAMFVRRDQIDGSSFFPEIFFMYFEDVLLGERLKRNGDMVFYPFCKVTHNRVISADSVRLYVNSLFRFFKQKEFGIFKISIIKLIILSGLIIRYFCYKIAGIIKKNNKNKTRATVIQIKEIFKYPALKRDHV